MEQDEHPWRTFQARAKEIAAGQSTSGRSRESTLRDAVRKLWHSYWQAEFKAESLRLTLVPRGRPTARDATHDMLQRCMGDEGPFDLDLSAYQIRFVDDEDSYWVPREITDLPLGPERSSAISDVDPYEAWPGFLRIYFLRIEVSQSEWGRWRRWRAAGNRDNGRRLLGQWFTKRTDAWLCDSRKADVLAAALSALGEGSFSLRAFDDAWKEGVKPGSRRRGRPSHQGARRKART